MEAKKHLEEKNGTMTFARSLKAWRKSEELTIEALAKKIGLTKTAISRFENGHDFPSSETVKALAKVLKADQAMWMVYIVRDMIERKGFEGVEVRVKRA